ncbi:MAG: type VII toxin-antitoxin system MntA family adenylyltransferase antitoxin [Candidatus Njordarchaeales archaeon]
MNSLDALVKKLKKCLEDKENILFAILFGSIVKGDFGENSDIDIAIRFRKRPSLEKLVNLIVELSECLNVNEDKIDITIIDNDLPLELRYKILRDGILVFARALEDYKIFRDVSISMYIDFRKALELVEYGKKYLKKAEELLWK